MSDLAVLLNLQILHLSKKLSFRHKLKFSISFFATIVVLDQMK